MNKLVIVPILFVAFFQNTYAQIEYYKRANEYGKFGLFSPQHKSITGYKYDYITGIDEGRAIVSLNEKWGAIDMQGNVVVDIKYEDLNSFSEGLASVKINNKWGYLDKYGKIRIRPQYSGVGYFSEGLAPVKRGDKWGYVDKKNNVFISFKYNYALEFEDGEALVEYFNGRKTESYYIDKNEKKYEWAEYNYYYLDEKRGAADAQVEFGCHSYLNPFSGQQYIEPYCSPKDDCVECFMLYGKGYIHYIDRYSNEQFVLAGDIDGEGKYTYAIIYGFDSQDNLVRAFTTEIRNGIIVNIIPVKRRKRGFSSSLNTSIMTASLASLINDNLSFQEAIGCAINYNVNQTINTPLTANIINEAVSSYTQKRKFNSNKVILNSLKAEVKNRLSSETNLSNSQVSNIISFISCLAK